MIVELWGAEALADNRHVASVDADVVLARVFRADGPALVGLARTGLASNMSVRIVGTDSSGRHFLMQTFVEGDPGFTLYRWSEGDAQPTKLAEGIWGADW